MSSVDPCILIWGDRGIYLRLRATEQSTCYRLYMYICVLSGIKVTALNVLMSVMVMPMQVVDITTISHQNV